MAKQTDVLTLTLDPDKLKACRGSIPRATIGSLIGVGSSQVANYENDYRKPSADSLLRLMILYGVKAQDLVKDEHSPDNNFLPD